MAEQLHSNDGHFVFTTMQQSCKNSNKLPTFEQLPQTPT
jgi:hypothetical protein